MIFLHSQLSLSFLTISFYISPFESACLLEGIVPHPGDFPGGYRTGHFLYLDVAGNLQVLD